MHLEIVGKITQIQVIAAGPAIRERRRLWKAYGRGSRRKLKGIATIKLNSGTRVLAELDWYEAHGIGEKEFKINGSSRPRAKGNAYVLCVRNEGYPASLERGKLYPKVRDAAAAKQRLIRGNR